MNFTFCRGARYLQSVNRMSKFSSIKEFLRFLREGKTWWIAPIVIFLLILGALPVFAKGSALSPFIYSLF